VDRRIDIISVAVDDLARAIGFYRDGLGWPSWSHPADATDAAGAPEPADHAVFELQGGLSFVLYAQASLARDAQEPEMSRGATRFILSHYAASKDGVDALLRRAEAAGATLVGDAQEEPWGYAGSFRDLDGHLWQVVWNRE
jgi:predicted lactoylglutathione lyase